MPNFWSYITRGKYSVGCTGQTVYVYEDGQEVFRQKGFLYTYQCCVSPDLEYFALKSSMGLIYIYSLKELTLPKKLRVAKSELTQDEKFTFSLSGKELISVVQ